MMSAKIDITVEAITRMNHRQFEALQNNVLGLGLWENARECVIRTDLSGAMGVQIKDGEGKQMIFIGIESDGYTHS